MEKPDSPVESSEGQQSQQPGNIRTVTQEMTVPAIEEETELTVTSAGVVISRFIKGETFLLKGTQFRIERIDQLPNNVAALLVVPCGSGSKRHEKQRRQEQKRANREKLLKQKKEKARR